MKVGLIATRRDPVGRPRVRSRSRSRCSRPASSSRRRKHSRFSSGDFPSTDPDPPAGAERMRRRGRTSVARQEVLADRADPPGHVFGRQSRREPVLIIERLGQDGEDLRVPILVVADASEVVHQGRRQLGQLGSQLEHAVVAKSSGQLGIDIEQAEVTKAAVAQVLADVPGDLPRERSERDDQRGQGARHGGLTPANVLLHGAGPAGDGPRDLTQVRPGLQRPIAQAEDRARR